MKRNKAKTEKILTKKKPEKKLLMTIKKKAGRSSSGRISVRHRGGGAKRRYRIIDFGQEKIDIPAKVIAIEYDPYRTGYIALLEYQGGEKRYILAPHNIKIGDSVIVSEKAEIKLGNRVKLKNISVGTEVHNVEVEMGCGGKIVRGAGTFAKVLAQEGKYTHLQLPSTEVKKFLNNCYATIGIVSKPEWKYTKDRKAGTSRLRGRRPVVRGTAMNPVDHPHGGGEGKAPIGLKHPKTPWGKPALGVKTRKKKKKTNKFIVRGRKRKR